MNTDIDSSIADNRSDGEAAQPGRWLALAVLCMGVLMIMVDSTIVNVALPSIKSDLNFSDSTLPWVVNSYFLTYGGFLLLGGRLGDIFGQKLLFVIGLSLFTVASLTCGLAQSPLVLIVSRAIQGLGGAVVTAVAMSLIVTMFSESSGRARAMGAYGFVCASGASLGAIAGGLLTTAFGWPAIFIVNLPIGALVILLSFRLLPEKKQSTERGTLDVMGALTGTGALILLVYVVLSASEWGWGSVTLFAYLLAALILLAAFLIIEMRVSKPLMPLRLFKIGNVVVANIVVILWAAALFSWFFLSALYLQLVNGYDPLQVGLAFLPANIIIAIFSLGVSERLINAFGIKRPLVCGLVIAAAGLALLSFAPANGAFTVHVLPGMLLFGVGAGIAINPMLLSATSGVDPSEAGLASGIVNTSFAMGGSLWLAIITSVAALYTSTLLAQGMDAQLALNSGYNVAFMLAACLCVLGSVLAGLFLKV